MATGKSCGQLLDEMAVVVGAGGNPGDDFRASLLTYLNWGGKKVWTKYGWPERIVDEFIITAAPYETGTATVTNGSATVTGSGTSWTSAMVGRRFGLSAAGPWYRISAVGSSTSLTLDRVYNETTTSGTNYSIYADEYSLPSTVESVSHVALLQPGWYGRQIFLEQGEFDEGAAIPLTRGKCRFWTIGVPLTTAPQTRRIRLWPVPDQVYNVKIRGMKRWVDMTTESDFPIFDEDREPEVLLAALLYAQRMGGTKEITSVAEVEDAIDKLWASTQPARPKSGRRRPFDSATGLRYRPFGPAQA